MMINKTFPSIAIKLPSETLHSEFNMHQADENELCKKSKNIRLPIISMCLSLMIFIIPIIWFVYMYMTGDDKNLTDHESSNFINNLQGYELSLNYSRSSDRFGYHVSPEKIPGYRN